jgi:hypothetical protein
MPTPQQTGVGLGIPAMLPFPVLFPGLEEAGLEP